jgi:hypothetical protein
MIYTFYFTGRQLPPSNIRVDACGRLCPRANLRCASRALFAETWEYMYTPNAISSVQILAWNSQPFVKLCNMLHRLCGIVVTTNRVRVKRLPKEDRKVDPETISANIKSRILAHWIDGAPL